MLEALNLKNNTETRYRCQVSVYRTIGPLVIFLVQFYNARVKHIKFYMYIDNIISHFVPTLCVLGHYANSQLKIVVARAINFYFVFLNP